MFKKKKILALVPARGGSKGIKFKNLKKINNISLIGHTSNFIDSCGFFDNKILSSDHIKILNEGKKYNFKILKRLKKISGDKISDYEVIKHAIRDRQVLLEKYDYLVYLQPTSPIRKINQLKKALEIVIGKSYDAAWSISKVDKKFHPLKILYIKNKSLTLFSQLGKKIIARQMLDDIYIRNGIFYIFKIKKIENSKNIYFKKCYPSLTNYRHINIDTNKDLIKAKFLMKKIDI